MQRVDAAMEGKNNTDDTEFARSLYCLNFSDIAAAAASW